LDRNDLWEIYRDRLNDTPAKEIQAQGNREVYLEFTTCPSNVPPSRNGPQLAYAVNCGMIDGSAAGSTPSQPDFIYNGVFHNRGLGSRFDVTSTDFKDGAASTLMISERRDYPQSGWGVTKDLDKGYEMELEVGFIWQLADTAQELQSWQINEPQGTNAPGGSPRSYHPDLVIVAFCDGHTQNLSGDIDYRVYQHLMTPDSRRARENSGADPANLAGTLNEGDYK